MTSTPPVTAKQKGANLVRDILGDNLERAHDTFTPEMKAAVPLERLKGLIAEIKRSQGALDTVVTAEASENGPAAVVQVLAVFQGGSAVFTLTFVAEDKVAGLYIKPFDPKKDTESKGGPADDYVSKRAYRVPADGAFRVVHGGRSSATNHHVGNTQQWYAYDIVMAGPDGKTYRTDGKTNEDYYCYGKPLLAPADGTIVAVIDGIPDNTPGDRDKYFIPGNLVVIDHGDGEHSFLAHVKKGSIVVKVGQKVKRGQVLGSIGNSGNTSEPHIHWHLTNHPNVSMGAGLPIRLDALTVNGKAVDSAEPVRGDIIESRR